MRRTRITRRRIVGYSVILFLSVIPYTICSTPHNKSSESYLSFLTQCIDLASLGIGLQCRGTVCKGEEGSSLNLEQVKKVECVRNSDCMTKYTGMQCVAGLCDCPPYQALNISSCSCQATAQCQDSSGCTEHNGRKCWDSHCSCYSSIDYATLLVDPSTLFCLIPGDNKEEGGEVSALAVGLIVVAGLVLLILVALAGIPVCKACKWGKSADIYDSQDIVDGLSEVWDDSITKEFKTDEDDIIFTYLQTEEKSRSISGCRPFSILDQHNLAYVDEDVPADH